MVHASAGWAALAWSFAWASASSSTLRTHPFSALSTGLLWFGVVRLQRKRGELKVDDITALAFLNPILPPRSRPPPGCSSSGLPQAALRGPLLTGAVAGLAAITPAAGSCRSTPRCHRHRVCVRVLLRGALKNRLRWDDALDVWGVHGVGGMLGIILLGVFASFCHQSGRRGGRSTAARPSSSRSWPRLPLAYAFAFT